MEHKYHYLLVISCGPLVIVRLPWPTPRWRAILKALTPVMHAHGLRQQDISMIEFLATDDPNYSVDHEFYRNENEETRKTVAAAYAGDPDRYPKFWLYNWQRDVFVLTREPRDSDNPS